MYFTKTKLVEVFTFYFTLQWRQSSLPSPLRRVHKLQFKKGKIHGIRWVKAHYDPIDGDMEKESSFFMGALKTDPLKAAYNRISSPFHLPEAPQLHELKLHNKIVVMTGQTLNFSVVRRTDSRRWTPGWKTAGKLSHPKKLQF